MTFDQLESFVDHRHDRLYAIFGYSKRSDRIRLFYVGQTEREILSRLSDENHSRWQIEAEHYRHWDIRLRAGCIFVGRNRRVTDNLVNEIEAGLIFHLSPEFNIQNRSTYWARDMTIQHRGRKGGRPISGLPTELDI